MTVTATQPEDFIEKVQKKVGGSKDSTEHRKDWTQRQTNSTQKRKTSQRSPTFSSQICEVTGSSTHSFDDEKFCLGTGPSSGGGLFSDDNITQNEGESKRAAIQTGSKEILLLDCEETDTKHIKTSNFLKGLKTEKQTKRADSGNDKADWSTVGSGLIMVHKGSRESEPDFTNIFVDERTSTVDQPFVLAATDGYLSSKNTRMSTTISNKTKTDKPQAQ